MKEAWCCSSEMNNSFTSTKGTSFFMFYMALMMTEQTFGCCENFKTQSRAIFHDFYPGKGTFGLPFWNSSTENFEMMFPEWPIKNVEFSSGVQLFCSASGRIPRRPSDPSSSRLKIMLFFWVHMQFLWHRRKEAKNSTTFTINFLIFYIFKNF